LRYESESIETPSSSLILAESDYGWPGLSNKASLRPEFGGDYHDLTYVTEPQVAGLVLIRIQDLRSSQAGLFLGHYVAGAVVGTDTIGGKAIQRRLSWSSTPAILRRHRRPGGGFGTFGRALSQAGRAATESRSMARVSVKSSSMGLRTARPRVAEVWSVGRFRDKRVRT
jgi:hypothetical protein